MVSQTNDPLVGLRRIARNVRQTALGFKRQRLQDADQHALWQVYKTTGGREALAIRRRARHTLWLRLRLMLKLRVVTPKASLSLCSKRAYTQAAITVLKEGGCWLYACWWLSLHEDSANAYPM